MTVQDFVIERCRRSEAKTPRNEPISRSIHSICTVSITFRSRSWRCVRILWELNCLIQRTAGTWSPRVKAYWISTRFSYFYSRGGRCDCPTRSGQLWDQRVKWNNSLYTFLVLLKVPKSSDVCQTLRRASCNPWQRYFRDPSQEIGPRNGTVFRSETAKNRWYHSVEMFTAWCPANC